jgi:hypothetical protein
MIEVKIDEQIAEAERELKTREHICAVKVATGNISKQYADASLAKWRALKRTLQFAKRDHGANYGTSGEPDEKK